MNQIYYLSEHVGALYSELLERLMASSYSYRGLSFVKKKVKARQYWYLEVSIGADKKQYYFGPDDEQTRSTVESIKAKREHDSDAACSRKELVSMLMSGGVATVSGREFRVLEALAQSGAFQVGGVLVGSHAFRVIGNMLGVKWNAKMTRTQDIDIADDFRIHISIPDVRPDIWETLKAVDSSFFKVPTLNPKAPSTSFSIRGAELRIDVLTPMIGREDHTPIKLRSINAMATPVRFLDYLLEDVQPAAVIGREGVLVNIPSPARYALHKLVLSQRRPPAMQLKKKKDLLQASELLMVVNETRPGDIDIACNAAAKMPRRFIQQLQAGASAVSSELGSRIRETLNIS